MTTVERMKARFDGFADAYGTYVLDGKTTKAGKVTGKPATLRGTVTTGLWEAHLAGKKPLGIVPIRRDNTCSWGCIDVDTYPLDHAALIQKIRGAKLPLLVCRSKSGGAHLFLFTSEPVAAATMQARLREMAAVLGYGRSEIFPKQTQLLADDGDIGNWLNMPYAGTITTRYAFKDDGTAMTIEEFLDAADAIAQPADALDDPIEAEGADEFADGPPCLQLLAKQGFPAGTRNNGLFHLGVFFRKAFPEEHAWREQLERANRNLMDPPLPSDEVQTIIKSLARKDYAYKCSDQPAASYCNSAQCRLRKYGVGNSAETFDIRNLIKQKTDPATWFVDVNDKRVRLTTDELMNQRLFKRVCLDRESLLPPTMKQEKWEEIIKALLVNLDEREVAPMEPKELDYLKRFLRWSGHREGQRRNEIFMGRAVLENGKYYFRIEDFEHWLDKNKYSKVNRNDIYNVLKNHLKTEHVFWNVRHAKAGENEKKQRGISVWPVEASILDGEIEEPNEAPQEDGDGVPF